jgi:hypothetical protein
LVAFAKECRPLNLALDAPSSIELAMNQIIPSALALLLVFTSLGIKADVLERRVDR